MAVAVSSIVWNNVGSQNSTSGTLTFSGTYATGGVSLPASAVGLGAIQDITFNEGAYVFKYDYSADKVLIYLSAGVTPAGTVSAPTITTTTNAGVTTPVYTNGGALTQVAGATGITGVQAPTFTGTAIAAAGLAELANSASLTGITTQFRAVGY